MDPKEIAAKYITAPAAPEKTDGNVKGTEAPPEETADLDDTLLDERQGDEAPEGELETPESGEGGEEEKETEEVFTLRIEGKDHEVSLDELIQSYQISSAARLRLQEATQARAAAVEEGRTEGLRVAQVEIEETRQSFDRTRQQLSQLVGIIGQQLFAPQVGRPDPSLEVTDPIGYLTAVNHWREDQARIQGLQMQIAQITEGQRAEMAAQEREVQVQNRNALLQKRPDLRDPERQRAFTGNVRTAQAALGFTQAEVDSFPDHRGLLALDLLGYFIARERAGGPTPAERIVGEGKNLKPGAVTYKRTQRQKERRANRDKAAQTGDYRDVAKLLIEDAPRRR